MSQAPTRARRNHTARELANRFGTSTRTIQRTVAEDRSDYLNRAENRHQNIRDLREGGMTMRQIAAELNISVGTVHYALKKSGENAP